MYRGMGPAAGPKPAACSRFRNPPFPDPPFSSDPTGTPRVEKTPLANQSGTLERESRARRRIGPKGAQSRAARRRRP